MSKAETVVQTKHGVASRAYDHMYDNTYTIASRRDLERSERQNNPGLLKHIPDTKNMFSVLPHHPAGSIRVENHDPLPASIPRDFQNRRALQQVEDARAYSDADPQGRDRYKYRARPLPGTSGGSLEQHQRATFSLVKFAEKKPAEKPSSVVVEEPKTRTVFIQTDYRENDTQTDPWTPEYVLRPGSAPEILTLANLSYGHGLPAGLAEVEMIERARAKRKWADSLPGFGTQEEIQKRLQLMEEQELEEWKQREQDIERLQQERLDLMKQLLQQRNEGGKMALDAKLDKLYSERQANKSSKIDKLQATALKTVRSLNKTRAQIEAEALGTTSRRDVIDDYSNPASTIFAPLARQGGSVIEKQGNQFVVDSFYLKTYKGLLELESSLPQDVTKPRIVQPSLRAKPQGRLQRETLKLQESLKSIDINMTLTKTIVPTPLPPPKLLQVIPKPPVRPPTPTVEDVDDNEADLDVIVLQKFIRGRAQQNAMFEGKERRQELIAELRSTHALRDTEIVTLNEVNADLQHERAQMQDEITAQAASNSVLADVQGSNVGHMLDFLSKELVRLQEERRIHAFAMMAERQRRMREAEESGKRQIEESRRQQQDAVFRQVVKVHQATVDTYLEDLILGAKSQSADDQARTQIRKKAETINAVAQELYDSGYDKTELGAEAIVSELVSSFLLPEVKKQSMRLNVAQSQRKFLQAAHKEIHAASNATAEASGKQPENIEEESSQ